MCIVCTWNGIISKPSRRWHFTNNSIYHRHFTQLNEISTRSLHVPAINTTNSHIFSTFGHIPKKNQPRRIVFLSYFNNSKINLEQVHIFLINIFAFFVLYIWIEIFHVQHCFWYSVFVLPLIFMWMNNVCPANSTQSIFRFLFLSISCIQSYCIQKKKCWKQQSKIQPKNFSGEWEIRKISDDINKKHMSNTKSIRLFIVNGELWR